MSKRKAIGQFDVCLHKRGKKFSDTKCYHTTISKSQEIQLPDHGVIGNSKDILSICGDEGE
jgi:hypothetical protein